MIRVTCTLLLLALAIPLSGCVIAGPGYGGGGRYCYYHPYRCR